MGVRRMPQGIASRSRNKRQVQDCERRGGVEGKTEGRPRVACGTTRKRVWLRGNGYPRSARRRQGKKKGDVEKKERGHGVTREGAGRGLAGERGTTGSTPGICFHELNEKKGPGQTVRNSCAMTKNKE